MPTEPQARYWTSAARSLARRINLGWWLERWIVWVMAAAIAGSVALLLMRWMRPEELRWVWISTGALVFGGAIVAWIGGRGRFESAAAARVRLEDALGLKTRLSAAAAGVGSWPEPVEKIKWPVKWRWQRPLAVCAFTAAMLLLAAWIPVTQRDAEMKRAIEKPTAAKDVEQWMQALKQEQAVDGKTAEDVEKKIADILKRPAENWYEHGSLEAAGNLKEQTAADLREMQQNLADAERAAAALQAMGDSAPQAVKDSLANGLDAASKSLAAGGMKPNEQLLEQLQKMGGQSLNSLSKEQMQQLADALRKNQEALQKALGECKGFDPSGIPNVAFKEGQGKDDPDGKGKPGKGGTGGGKTPAPMAFGPEENNLDTKKIEALTSQIDPSRAAPGDMIKTTDGKHEVDKSAYKGPQQSGGVTGSGDGGSAVWQNSLMPGERNVLKKYFK